MILILGGTHEGRQISDMLTAAGEKHMFSVTTALGQKTYAGPDTHCVIKRFTEKDLCEWILAHDIRLIIDATHPHALEIKQTAKKTTAQMRIPYIRYERNQLSLSEFQSENITVYKTMTDITQTLKQNERVADRYLITGTKHIDTFYQTFDKSKCYFRVMPSVYSLKTCELHGVPLENILAIKAPCPVTLNHALFQTYGITHFIFKNSGEGSAFKSNIEAIKNTKIKGLVLTVEPERQAFTTGSLDALRILIQKMHIIGGYDV